ncbi:endolysin [Caudoviricetes sp.]|nr:endolysin [Caudoviricetes sp.]
MSYTTFKNNWLNKKVDYDHVYAHQCVDLILQYVKEEFGLASGVWGNAIDYWRRPTATLLTKFDLVSSTDCKQGDIVVLNGLTGNPYGHIGICDSQDATSVAILEQNGSTGNGSGVGGDAVRTRAVPKTRIAGLLRPKAAPAPPSVGAPARSTVFLPASARSWNLYHVGSYLRPRTPDVKAVLAPSAFGGLTYKIISWVGDYAVVIETQMFGRGVVWLRGTDAVVK